MINILSIDVEHRLQAPSRPLQDNEILNIDEVKKSITMLLDLFKEFNARATFFVSGIIAEKIPETVREIFNHGHEIASHGYSHTLISSLTESQFENDLVKSLDILTAITGSRPVGYRTPYWSITKNSLWALRILSRNGIKYDSSIYPTKNYLYGIADFPRFPHYMKEYEIYEFPGSTFRFYGKNIPFGGGFYLRVFPLWLTNLCMRNMDKQSCPSMIYFHPHELSKERYPLPLWHKENFILNYGKISFIKKIRFLLASYKFLTMREYFNYFYNLFNCDGNS